MKRSLLLALAASACAPMSPPPITTISRCMADNVADLDGKVLTSAIETDAAARLGSRAVRVIRPGQAVTMDYREDRLNIGVSDANVIIKIYCG